MKYRALALVVMGAAICCSSGFALSVTDAGLERGKLELSSAGVLAFGPDAILLVADSKAGAIVALDTGDRDAAPSPRPEHSHESVLETLADKLGAPSDQVTIHDLAVNPISGALYLSASRGAGPDALPLIARLGADGSLEVLSLDDVSFSRVVLPNAPDPAAKSRRGASLRLEAITDQI